MELARNDQTEAALRGEANVWKSINGIADFMVMKCALELRIPDIVHSHSAPITLAQIASSVPDSPSLNLSYLSRIMRLLVRRKIFSQHKSLDGEEVLYGPTHSSRLLLSKTTLPDQVTLAPFVAFMTHPYLSAPWSCLARCVKEGGNGFEMVHGGRQLWDLSPGNPEFNKVFNDGMASTARITTMAILSEYRDVFCGICSLVDVGGEFGGSISAIVKSHPHIKGINYDLPHVVATAPTYTGLVSHVGGNMFEWIPTAVAVFMKWILHDWADEDCVKILKNCRRAMPEKGGKIIIVDIVLEPEGNGLFDDAAVMLDIALMALTRGKERTEKEWKRVLEEGGFPRYQILKIPALTSVIEAYPQ
uniref:Xanthohumol 4-O-methyltransferase n=1 Tax=Humulus lupulus TaxID=3486 RepID=OMT2_HUMLU|nr:RecName: Full=Xanthohumol 4-O-methyltransferase; AltName: Full=Desmethylxanthohumol 6'-O-methyltransferase; AltName: Full=Isoliquiritigenin 2'-O-methyltransferase; AltName: Full=O-methyltransferase 2; Short=HlOMT2 [Humulus lupulus]ABZ89566.1 O-methyltransferase 2 [Humulus lupulus]